MGSDAELTIVDREMKVVITEDRLLEKAGYTPYEGLELDGAITMSLLRGEVLMEDGKVLQPTGYGNFLESGPPIPPLLG